MLAEKIRSYQVNRDKEVWDQAKALWNKNVEDFGKAAVTVLAFGYGDSLDVRRVKLHYVAGEINFDEAMDWLDEVEGR